MQKYLIIFLLLLLVESGLLAGLKRWWYSDEKHSTEYEWYREEEPEPGVRISSIVPFHIACLISSLFISQGYKNDPVCLRMCLFLVLTVKGQSHQVKMWFLVFSDVSDQTKKNRGLWCDIVRSYYVMAWCHVTSQNGVSRPKILKCTLWQVCGHQYIFFCWWVT